MQPRKHKDTKKNICLLLVTFLIACNRSSLVFQQPATLTDNLVVLPTRVNGSEQLPFILDTGASATVIEIDAYPLPRPGYRRVAITAGALLPGQVPAFVTRIQGLQLGPAFLASGMSRTLNPSNSI